MANAATTPQKYVAYYRVSTGAQSLGLDAQRARVIQFAAGRPIVSEFTEKLSGKDDARPELAAAIAKAELEGATLVVAKLDRLSRSVAFLFELKSRGVDFAVVDMPELNSLTLGIFAGLAQHERELISERTKAALAAKKAAGHQLGTPENLTDEARAKGVAARQAAAAANANNRKASGYIQSLRQAGLSFHKIADRLNAEGFHTSRGKQFAAATVRRLWQRTAAAD